HQELVFRISQQPAALARADRETLACAAGCEEFNTSSKSLRAAPAPVPQSHRRESGLPADQHRENRNPMAFVRSTCGVSPGRGYWRWQWRFLFSDRWPTEQLRA